LEFSDVFFHPLSLHNIVKKKEGDYYKSYYKRKNMIKETTNAKEYEGLFATTNYTT